MTISDIQSRLLYWAAVYGVPPALAVAVAQRESNFNQAARGSASEVGVMQITPAAASWLGVDPSDPEQGIEGGVRLLSYGYAKFRDWSYALAGYNCGMTCAERGPSGWPASTRAYVQGVMAAAGITVDAGGPADGTTGATGAWDGTAPDTSTDTSSILDQLGAMDTTTIMALVVVGVLALVLLTDRDRA
jgi:hypothetical protein